MFLASSAITAECCRALRHGLSSCLSLEHGQRAGDTLAGGVRHDHVVDEAAGAGHKRVGELGLVLGFALGELGGVVLLFAEDDLHRAPSGPITAISADGQARFTSPRRCLEDITSYAPP